MTDHRDEALSAEVLARMTSAGIGTPDRTILELGAATGMVTLGVIPDARHYVGVDSGGGFLQPMRSRYPYHRWIDDDLDTLRNTRRLARRFDSAVLLWGAFNRCQRPLHAVEAIADCLAPDATLFVQAISRRQEDRHRPYEMSGLASLFAARFRQLSLSVLGGPASGLLPSGLPKTWHQAVLHHERKWFAAKRFSWIFLVGTRA